MEKSSKKLTDLPHSEKSLILIRIFCNEHVRDYCQELGLRPDDTSTDTLNTIIGVDVVEALTEGLQEGLAAGVQKIMDQRLESAETIDRWVK